MMKNIFFKVHVNFFPDKNNKSVLLNYMADFYFIFGCNEIIHVKNKWKFVKLHKQINLIFCLK